MFLEAAAKYKRGERKPDVVKAYEKIMGGHDFTSPRLVLKRSDTRMLRERILICLSHRRASWDREEYIVSFASEYRKLQIV
ncbi:MAG: hypothetical protein ABSG74_13830 [Candidatus Bathyarchaeia archaeon]